MSETSNQPRMKVGMVGVSGFGAARRRTLRQAGLFDLVACYDRNPDAMKKAQEEDGAKPTQSLDELLQTPGLEGLVISTGVDSHVELAVRGLEAGLHVLVEKPLCGRPEEAQRLIEARDRTGLVVATGHSDYETSAIYQLGRQYIDAGKLGTLVCYEENSSHSGGLEIKPGDWRGLRENNPGGMLLQCGVHSVHLLRYLIGPIDKLDAMMRYDAHDGTETADAANVLLHHENGLIGTLNCYHTTGYVHELRLFGTKGNLYMDTIQKRAWFQPRKRGEREDREEITVPKAPEHAGHANVINWFRAVREGRPPQPSLEDGVEAVLVVFAAERADHEGRRVALSEIRESIAAHA